MVIPTFSKKIKIIDDSDCDGLVCEALVFTDVTSQCKAMQWIEDLQDQTKTTFRVTRGTKVVGKKILYKTVRHCQHKRKPSNKPLKKVGSLRNKKTECASSFSLKVYNEHSSTIHNHKGHPCEIKLLWAHNHAITCAKALSFRPISSTTLNLFQGYFEQGHSPSSALHLHHLNLAVEHGEDSKLDQMLADRSVNPLYSDVYYAYKNWRVKQHGEPNGERMFVKLEEAIKEYNNKHTTDGGRAYLQKFQRKDAKATDTPLVLAICTPLMARTHRLLQQAGELVFCDSTASLDRYNCPTFIVSTSSAGGGIPLGVVITSGESEDTLTECFAQLRLVLPEKAFYGRGNSGPKILMTDDSEAEKNALQNVWPEATQFLCIFHYLQAWWKY